MGEERMHPKTISVKDIDGFMVVKATERETGLPYDFYFECDAFERLKDSAPYFYACRQDRLVPISISDYPCVIDEEIEDGDFADAIEWAGKNKEILLQHWSGEIDDPQLIFAIKKQHRMELGSDTLGAGTGYIGVTS